MTDLQPAVQPLTTDTEYQELLSGRPRTAGMRSGNVRLRDGARCGHHTTGAHEESLVVYEGEGTVHIDGAEPTPVAAPATVYIPPETGHDIAAAPGGSLGYVYVVAPIAGTAHAEK